MVQKIKIEIIMVTKKLVYALAVMVFAVVAFSSCNKTDNEPVAVQSVAEEEFFVPSNDALKSAGIPKTQSDYIAEMQSRAKRCQCVEYIKFRLTWEGNNEATGNANAMDSWLYSQGYSPVSFSANNLPRNRDIVQFKNGVHGTNSTYGHIGMIATAQKVGNSIKVTVVGANQGSNTWTEYGCNNVSMMTISSLSTGGNVVIWRK